MENIAYTANSPYMPQLTICSVFRLNFFANLLVNYQNKRNIHPSAVHANVFSVIFFNEIARGASGQVQRLQ